MAKIFQDFSGAPGFRGERRARLVAPVTSEQRRLRRKAEEQPQDTQDTDLE